MNLDDPRWPQLQGGYRIPYDVRPVLARLRAEPDNLEAWDELWQELYHQGTVGEASYASVPVLAAIRRETGVRGWRIYGFVASVDLASTVAENPPVPDWLQPDYDEAIRDLSRIGLEEIRETQDPTTTCCILAMVALWKGQRWHARILLDYDEQEVKGIFAQILG